MYAMAASDEFKHESIQDRRSVVRYLQAVIDGLEKGHLELDSGEQTFVLEPRGLLKLEIQAKRKGGRFKTTLKFSWNEESAEDQAEKLTISA